MNRQLIRSTFAPLFITALAAVFTLMVSLGSALPTDALAPTQDPCRDELGNEICINYNANDGRVNTFDAIASVAGYCRSDYSVDVYVITGYDGTFAFKADGQQIVNALGAASGGAPVVVQAGLGAQLIAGQNNMLQLYDTRNGYKFDFSASVCGLPGPFAPSGVPVVVNPPNPPASGAVDPTARFAVVTIYDIWLRARPLYTGTRLLLIPANATVSVFGRSANWVWLRVRYNGVSGWTAAQYTSVTSAQLRTLPIYR